MIQSVQFTSFDALALCGTLTLPELPKAALLMIHGIPSDKDEWGFYSDMSKFFEIAEVASFRFDFRGCGESESFPISELTLSAMIADIDAAYWELRQAIGNSVPIHVVGTSCGGGVSVRWHNLLRRNIASIMLMAPVLDYEFEVTGEMRIMPPSGPTKLNSEKARTLKSTGKINDEIGYGRSMLLEAHYFDGASELSQVDCPVTIYQGDSDTVVPIAITRTMLANRQETDLIVVKGADHGFSVEGDDDLTDPATKANHRFVYQRMLEKI